MKPKQMLTKTQISITLISVVKFNFRSNRRDKERGAMKNRKILNKNLLISRFIRKNLPQYRLRA